METSTTVRLTLYVRSLRSRQTNGRQTAVLDRLETLTENGVVDGYSVVVWGRQLPTSSEQAHTAIGEQLSGQIATFEEWARRNGQSLDATFPTRDIESPITGGSVTARSVPAIALAEYHDDALAFVGPTDDGPTIEQRLGTLADGTARTYKPVERARSEKQPLCA